MSYFRNTLSIDFFSLFFFFNDTATTEIYTLSLHDALPPSSPPQALKGQSTPRSAPRPSTTQVGPTSRIQASSCAISTTRTPSGSSPHAARILPAYGSHPRRACPGACGSFAQAAVAESVEGVDRHAEGGPVHEPHPGRP